MGALEDRIKGLEGAMTTKIGDNIGWALLQLLLYAKFRAWPDWGAVWRTLRGKGDGDANDTR